MGQEIETVSNVLGFGAAGYRAQKLAEVAARRQKGKLDSAFTLIEALRNCRLQLELHAEATGKGWPFRATPEVRCELSRYGSPYAAKLSIGYEYEPADQYEAEGEM